MRASNPFIRFSPSVGGEWAARGEELPTDKERINGCALQIRLSVFHHPLARSLTCGNLIMKRWNAARWSNYS